MRTQFVLSLVLLLALILAGLWLQGETAQAAAQFTAAAQELRALAQAQAWEAAGERFAVHRAAWESRVPQLELLLDHLSVDVVSQAFGALGAGLESRSLPLCALACAQLEESARHLHHRDSFRLGNVF